MKEMKSMNNDFISYLQNEINENKISHAFLIETNICETMLQEISELFYKNELIPTQNIESNISIHIVRPDNNIIEKDKILELQKFIITTSIIDKYKIYFILNADKMNTASFNKLLKVLEEPSDNVIGFLITENENQIISTIKSRCKRFKHYYDISSRYDNTGIIEKLLKISDLKYLEITNLKNQLLNYDKNEIIIIFQKLKISILETISNPKELAKIYKILDNIIDLMKSNVNTELCLDKFFIEMRK